MPPPPKVHISFLKGHKESEVVDDDQENSDFWTQQGNHTYELTPDMAIRAAIAQSRPYPSM